MKRSFQISKERGKKSSPEWQIASGNAAKEGKAQKPLPDEPVNITDFVILFVDKVKEKNKGCSFEP